MPKRSHTRRSPYNLPNTWSPGLALPENVINEGLERHAIVTQQVPDGTFDNPVVGSGGYVVPEYIAQERYGRGTYVTAWAPRGTYYGPGLPDWLNYPVSAVESVQRVGANKVAYEMESLHGDDLPAPLASFGHRAANAVLSSVRRLPPSQRKAALRATMDKIDRSLWQRTATIAKRYQANGYPPAQALHAGLSRAMATGVAAETIKAGARKARGQRAEGFGYMGGLGADTSSKPLISTANVSSASASAAGSNCDPTMTWVAASGSTPAHWERTRAGQTPVPSPQGCYVKGSSDGRGAQGGVTVDGQQGTLLDPSKYNQSSPTGPMLQVGPWLFPQDADTYTIGPTVRDHRTGQARTPWDVLPLEWKQRIAQVGVDLYTKYPWFGRDNMMGYAFTPAAALGLDPALFPPLTGYRKQPGASSFTKGVLNVMTPDGLKPMPAGYLPLRFFDVDWSSASSGYVHAIPLFRVRHPTKGVDYGVYLAASQGLDYPPAQNTPGYGLPSTNTGASVNPYASWANGAPRALGQLQIVWRPVPAGNDKSWWDTIKDVITYIPSKIASGVQTVVSTVGDLACQLLTSDGGKAAIVGAGTSAGVAGTVAAAGAIAVGAACPKDTTPATIPPPPPAATGFPIVPLAIGVGVVGAAYLLSRKKR